MTNKDLIAISDLIDRVTPNMQGDEKANLIAIKARAKSEMKSEKYTVCWKMTLDAVSPLDAAKHVKAGYFEGAPIFNKVRVSDSRCGSFTQPRKFDVDIKKGKVEEVFR